MSSVGVKVNPSIAKDMKNGNLLCMICNTQVKSKIWTAHSNGRKHRENIELLKKRHAAAQSAPKRPPPEEHPEPSSSVPVKRLKEDEDSNETSELTAPAQTPWQRDGRTGRDRSRRVVPKNVIEGVPEGFFDDEKLNSRVVETIEKQATLEEEYANFMGELNEAKRAEEEREDIEQQSTAIEHDIEHIDEMIDHWKRVNKLELRRDEIYNSSTRQSDATNSSKPMDATSDDDEDFDLDDACNWRSKGI